MGQTIPHGSRVKVCCARWNVQKGEIAAYRRGGLLVIHRLVDTQEANGPDGHSLVFQGDANPASDLPIPPDRVIGVVVEILPPRLPVRFVHSLEKAMARLWVRLLSIASSDSC